MFFRRTFFVPQRQKLWQGNPFVLCFRKLLVANKTMDKRWGVSKFSVKSVLILKCRKNSLGNTSVLCFREIPVTKNSMDKRGGYQDLPTKVFCTTMPKTLARNPIVSFFGKLLVANKTTDKRGMGVSRFSIESLLNHNPEKFGKGTFGYCVSENFRCRKRLCITAGGYQIFPSNFFLS